MIKIEKKFQDILKLTEFSRINDDRSESEFRSMPYAL